MSDKELDQLKALLKLTPDIKYFDEYTKFYTMITGKVNQSKCNKCALRQIIKLLRNYIINK